MAEIASIYVEACLKTDKLNRQLKALERDTHANINVYGKLKTARLNKDLRDLEKNTSGRVLVNAILDTKELDRSLKAINNKVKASVIVEANLSTTKLDRQLKRLDGKTKGKIFFDACLNTEKLAKKIDKLNGKTKGKILFTADLDTSVIEKKITKLSKKELEISVDDKELTKLNKHLDKKEKHYKQVQRYFKNNPLEVNFEEKTTRSGSNRSSNEAEAAASNLADIFDKFGETIRTAIGYATDPLEKMYSGFFSRFGEKFSDIIFNSFSRSASELFDFDNLKTDLDKATGDVLKKVQWYADPRYQKQSKKLAGEKLETKTTQENNLSPLDAALKELLKVNYKSVIELKQQGTEQKKNTQANNNIFGEAQKLVSILQSYTRIAQEATKKTQAYTQTPQQKFTVDPSGSATVTNMSPIETILKETFKINRNILLEIQQKQRTEKASKSQRQTETKASTTTNQTAKEASAQTKTVPLPDLGIIPKEVASVISSNPKTAIKNVVNLGMKVASKAVERKLAEEMQNVSESIEKAAQAKASERKAELSKVKTAAENIRNAFKDLYAEIQQSLKDGNIALAKAQASILLETEAKYRAQLDILAKQAKDKGVSGDFGSELTKTVGSVKGTMTRSYVKPTQRLVKTEIDPKLAAKDMALELIQGLMIGLLDGKGKSNKVSRTVANQLLNKLKEEFGIRSPSWKTQLMGQQLIAGLIKGLYNNSKLMQAAGSIGKNLFSSLTNNSKIFQGIGNIFKGFANANSIKALVTGFKLFDGVLGGIANLSGKGIVSLFNFIKTNAPKVGLAIGNAAKGITGWLKNANIFGGLTNLAMNAGTGVIEAFKKVVGWVKNANIFGGLKNFAVKVGTGTIDVFKKVFGWLKNASGKVGGFFKGLGTGATNFIKKGFAGVKNIAGNTFDWIKNAAGGAANGIKNVVGAAAKGVQGVIGGVKNAFIGLQNVFERQARIKFIREARRDLKILQTGAKDTEAYWDAFFRATGRKMKSMATKTPNAKRLNPLQLKAINAARAQGMSRQEFEKMMSGDFDDDDFEYEMSKMNLTRKEKKSFRYFRNVVNTKQNFQGISEEEYDTAMSELPAAAYSMAALIQPLATGFASLAPVIASLSPLIASVGLAFQWVLPVVNSVKQALEEVGNTQNLLNKLTGSVEAGGKELDYVKDVAAKFNLDINAAAESYAKLAFATRGSTLEGQKTKDLFEGISAAVNYMGLSSQDSELMFMAFQQMISKGVISMEELRQQLGERFPLAFKVFADALNVTQPELIQLISSGQLLAEDVLPKVAQVLSRDFQGSVESAASNYRKSMNRISQQSFRFKENLIEAFGVLPALFNNTLASIFKIFNDNFKGIAEIGKNFLIGFTAQIGITFMALSRVVFKKQIDTIFAFIKSAWKAGFTTLLPFFAGVGVDMIAQIFGAKSAIANMVEGFFNMGAAVGVVFDDIKRNTSEFGTGFMEPFSEGGGMIADLVQNFQNLIKILPLGTIEFLALFLALDQFVALGKMFILPQLAMLGDAFRSMAHGVKMAVVNFKNFKATAASVLPNLVGLSKNIGAMALKTLPALVGSLAVMSFARGKNILDPLVQEIVAKSKQIETSFQSLGETINKLTNRYENLGETGKRSISKLDLPSRGIELNLFNLLGIDPKSVTADDFIKQINKGADVGKIESTIFGATYGLGSDLLDMMTGSSSQKRAIEAQNLGLGDFFTGNERFNTLAQKQLLNTARDIEAQKKGLTKIVKRLNLTGDKVGQLQLSGIQDQFNTIKAIDKQIAEISTEKAQLSIVDPVGEKQNIAQLDTQLKELFKQRDIEVKPFSDMIADIDNAKSAMDKQKKAIEDSDYPRAAKQALLDLLKPQEDLIEQAIQNLKDLHIYDIVKPLADIWKNTTRELNKAESALDRFNKAIKLSRVRENAALTGSNISNENLDRQRTINKLQEIVADTDTLRSANELRRKALEKMLMVPGAETDKNKKKQVDDLRKQIAEDDLKIAEGELEIANVRRSLSKTIKDQIMAIVDFYKGTLQQFTDTTIAFEKAQKNFEKESAVNRLKTAILGTDDEYLSAFVDSMIAQVEAVNEVAQAKLDETSATIQAERQFGTVVTTARNLTKTLPGAIQIELDYRNVDELINGFNNAEDLQQALKTTSEEINQGLLVRSEKQSEINEKLKEALDIITNVDHDLKSLNVELEKTEDLVRGITGSFNDITVGIAKATLSAINFAKAIATADPRNLINAENAQQGMNTIGQLVTNPKAVVTNITNAISGAVNQTVGAINQALGKNIAYASPSTTQSFDQVLKGSVSLGQSFFAKRRGNRTHRGIDFDSTENLGSKAQFQAMFPGVVKTTKAWRGGTTDKVTGRPSNAIRVKSQLPGMEGNFFVDYGHVDMTTIGQLKKGQQVAAGQVLGRLSVNDRWSTGGHLDLKILVPNSVADNFKTKLKAPKNPGYSHVDVKEFMRWYRKRADQIRSSQKEITNLTSAPKIVDDGTKFDSRQPSPGRSYTDTEAITRGAKNLEPRFKALIRKMVPIFGNNKDAFGNDLDAQLLKGLPIPSLSNPLDLLNPFGNVKNLLPTSKPASSKAPTIVPEGMGRDILPLSKTARTITRGGNELPAETKAKLTDLGKRLYALRDNKFILALSDAVARAEGTDFNKKSKNFGYGMLVGGENIKDFSGHPFVEGKRGYRHNSSASGRYQMMDFNYSDARSKRMNFGSKSDLARVVNYKGDNPGDFSPGMQDLYFIYSLHQRGVLNDVLQGNIGAEQLNKLAPHYASIQSGNKRSAYSGQGTKQGSHSNFLSFLKNRISERKTETQQTQTVTQPQTPRDNVLSQIETTATRLAQSTIGTSVDLGKKTKDMQIQTANMEKQNRISSSNLRLLETDIQLNRAKRNQTEKQLDELERIGRSIEQLTGQADPVQSRVQKFRTEQTGTLQQFADLIKDNDRSIVQLTDNIAGYNRLLIEPTVTEQQKEQLRLQIKDLETLKEKKQQYSDQLKVILQTTLANKKNLFTRQQELFLQKQQLEIAQKVLTKEQTRVSLLEAQKQIDPTKSGVEIAQAQLINELESQRLDFQNQMTALEEKRLTDADYSLQQYLKDVQLLQQTNNLTRERLNLLGKQREIQAGIDDDKGTLQRQRTLEDFENQPRFELVSKQFENYRGNEFVKNRRMRELEGEQENIRYQRQLEDLNIQIRELAQQGINIPDTVVTKVKEDLQAINELNLEGIAQKYKTFGDTLNQVGYDLTMGLSQGLTDVIMGTASLEDTLDNFFDNILSSVLNIGLNSLFGGIFGGLFNKGGLVSFSKGGMVDSYPMGGKIPYYPMGGKLPYFGSGGKLPNYATGLSDGLLRERRESGRRPQLAIVHAGELIIPAEQTENLAKAGLTPDKLLGDFSRYANGGMVGGSVIPSRDRNTTITVETTVINNQEFVTISQFEEGVIKAAKQGGELGYNKTLNTLRNSSSIRKNTGF